MKTNVHRQVMKSVNRTIMQSLCGMMAFSVLLIAGVVLFLEYTMSSCAKPEKKRELQAKAVEALKLTVDNPDALQVLAVSNVDSVFNRKYVKDDELMGVLAGLNAFNEQIWSADPEKVFEEIDPKLWDRVKRGADVYSELSRYALDKETDKKKFTGYRVKVLYQYVDEMNDTVKNERYMIFDNCMQYLLHSIDIPIL